MLNHKHDDLGPCPTCAIEQCRREGGRPSEQAVAFASAMLIRLGVPRVLVQSEDFANVLYDVWNDGWNDGLVEGTNEAVRRVQESLDNIRDRS